MPQPNSKSPKKRLLAALVIFGPLVIVMGVVLLCIYHRPSAGTTQAGKTGAFNPSMPAPNLQKKDQNKLELYLEAEKDSLRRQQQLHSDPYAKAPAGIAPPFDSTGAPKTNISRPSGRSSVTTAFPPVDSNEKKMNDHLARLYAVLHTAPESLGQEDPNSSSRIQAQGLPDHEVDRLQKLEAALHQQDTTPSPQLRQIDALLEKVMAIQHPERLAPATPPPTVKSAVYPVSAQTPDSAGQDAAITGYDNSNNGFYGLTDEEETVQTAPAAIRAVIHADQTVQSGTVVKLRLLQDIFLKGIRIPANSFIFGPCEVGNERVAIHLSQVQYNGQVYPIDMKVFDGVDGLEGLYVPGAISRDVIKEGAAQGVGSIGLTSLDPSLGAQAAVAGIETAKTLFSRKIRLITATLKGGHVAILQPGQTHQ